MISVVIPAFNAGNYIAEAIESVLAQTCPPDEIIVIDDGSTDDTLAAAQSFGGKVRTLSQPNQGIGPARNRGIRESGGELLAFLDADDLWVPEKLALQMEALEAAPKPDLVFGQARQFASPDIADQVIARCNFSAEPAPAYVAGTLLAPRTGFDRVGMFATEWEVGEFIEWYLRAQDLGLRSVMLPNVALLRRVHATNTGIRRRNARGDYARIIKAAMDRRKRLKAQDKVDG